MADRGSIVVTGASSGIGRAAAVMLTDDGYDVVAAMRRPETLVSTAGRYIKVLPLDLAEASAVGTFAAAVLAHGPVRALVNAAGVPCLGAIEELPAERLRSAMEVNFFGTLTLCQAVAGALRRQGGGSIINVSSSLGVAALPLYGGYCASKAALEAASEALRHELAPFGVAVRLLQPGLVATAFGGKRQAQAPAMGSPYADRLDSPEPADLGTLVSRPEDVVAVLREMIERPDGPFRVTCGEDARRWTEQRRQLDDAAFFQGVETGGYAFR